MLFRMHVMTVVCVATCLVFCKSLADTARVDKPLQKESEAVPLFTKLAYELVRIKDPMRHQEKLKAVREFFEAKNKNDKNRTVDAVLDNLTNKNSDKERRKAWLQIFYAMRLNDKEKIAMASRLLPESIPEKKEFVYDILSSVPCIKGDWLDYRFDPDFLREQKEKLHHPFVCHIYSVYPERGFPHLVDNLLDVDKQELFQAHALLKKAFPIRMRAPRGTKETVPKQDVLDTLASLAKHKEWWVRLYVAKILKKNASYRDADVLSLLQKDENELIRQQTGSLNARNKNP